VVGIVTGHHGVPRMGELVIFDPAKGRQEATGVVQRIPGRGKAVEPIVRDALVDGSWPKFLHPFPLSENYVLVSAKPTATSRWGVYLVDTFDNMILLAEMEGSALLEPVPVRKSPAPPVLADKVDTARGDCLVYLVDVYRGGGLAGIPRGTVKKLRLFTYSFSYHGIGGLYGVVGADGPWDVKRVLGTVPVEPDGSAYFRIPANTPVSIQPLDERGHALQIMRSWMVGMPGEFVTCVGCHERQNEAPPVADAASLRRTPAEIEPWRGAVRGFSYAREVQPAVDKFCVGCHSPDAGGGRFDPQRMPDLRGVPIAGWKSEHSGNGGGDAGKFSVGYTELARYVRRPGIESNIHLLPPMDFHASATELVQMLRKGHHGVSLDEEAWDRLATWIDLNAPFHGTWTEAVGAGRTKHQSERRRALLKLYAGMDNDEEAIPGAESAAKAEPVLPLPEAPQPPPTEVACPGWPFDAEQAKARQQAAGISPRTVDLGEGMTLELVPIPAGAFVMGSPDGHADERPATAVRIDRAFWIGRLEVTNEQYARFDPLHDSGVESKHGYQFGVRGYRLAGAKQPAVRVSWRDAMAFCQWLTSKAGGGSLHFTLPTEAQWEYACRAGSAAAFSYGGLDVDFSKFANLGDAKLRELAANPYTETEPMKNPNRFDDWVPKDDRFNDGALVSVDVGGYKPNAWGLHDMHGNVAEWTRSLYRPYPYRDDDGRNAIGAGGPALAATGDRVVRGGSWYDRPKRCTSSFRLAYPPYQGVFNVGFRVVAEEAPPVVAGRTAVVTAQANRAKR
jgi:formylglycine-generating enzyme required for sulfatase activity/cytochrome c553